MKPLGSNQRDCLRMLLEWKGWFPRAGWTWSTPSATIRIMESLVARGLAKPKVFKWCDSPWGGYVITAKGKRELAR